MVSSGSAQQGPASHWSAANPIPTIHKFVETLDKDKRDRDQRIDEEIKRRQQEAQDRGESFDHEAARLEKKGTRRVSDPVTGKEIEIEYAISRDDTKIVHGVFKSTLSFAETNNLLILSLPSGEDFMVNMDSIISIKVSAPPQEYVSNVLEDSKTPGYEWSIGSWQNQL